jgi:hypothetical protein
LFALGYPTLLVGVSLSVGFRRAGELTDLAASFLAALLFLVAAPTSWVFAFPFIEVTRFTILFVGVLTSFPLWYAAGAALADASATWPVWLRRYLVIAVGWTAFTILALGVIALLA